MTEGHALTAPVTERRLTGTGKPDYPSTLELVRLMAAQDAAVPLALARAAAPIAAGLDADAAPQRFEAAGEALRTALGETPDGRTAS